MHRFDPNPIRDATQLAIDWENDTLIRTRARLHGHLLWFRQGKRFGVPQMKALSDNLNVLKLFAVHHGIAHRVPVQSLHCHVT